MRLQPRLWKVWYKGCEPCVNLKCHMNKSSKSERNGKGSKNESLEADCSMCAPLMAADYKLALLIVITSVHFCQCHRTKQDLCFLTNYTESYTLLITNAGKVHISNMLQS